MDLETQTESEIANPNNELTVTYLFYELERQYWITERIHRLTPVILVAQSVPKPHEVDEGWVLAHEWVLRRVLLDDMFHDAMDIIPTITSDELDLALKKKHMDTQLRLVEDLGESMKAAEQEEADLEDRLFGARMNLARQRGGKGVRKKKRRIAKAEAEVDAFEQEVDAAAEAVEEWKQRLQAAAQAAERATVDYSESTRAMFRNRHDGVPGSDPFSPKHSLLHATDLVSRTC